MNENGFHRLGYLDGWSPVGRIAWERLESVAMLEEVCPCWRKCGLGGSVSVKLGFEVSKVHATLVSLS